MADLNMGADAGTERNDNANANENENQNVHGGNVGGAYQEGVAPAAAAAAAAHNRLNNNAANGAANDENEINARANRIAIRSGEDEGIRRSAGNWQSGLQQIKWLRRIYVQPMRHSRVQMLRNTVYVAGQREMEHYRREMRKKPIMISTSSLPGSAAVSRNITHVRGRHVVGRTRSSNALPNARPSNSASVAAASRASTYRTRAVREREEQDIDDDDDDDHSATSASSDSSDGTLAEDQMSSSDSSDSQSSAYSDWVNPVCTIQNCSCFFSYFLIFENLFSIQFESFSISLNLGCRTTNTCTTKTITTQTSQTTFLFTQRTAGSKQSKHSKYWTTTTLANR